jgi:hypothetical protein
MRYLKLTILLVMTLALASCGKDFLTTPNPNKVNADSYWKNETQAGKGLIATYAGLRLDGVFGRWIPTVTNVRSDLAISDSPWNILRNLSTFNYIPSGGENEFIWRNTYHAIYVANQDITEVPHIKMDEHKKKLILAQAKFIRALLYFELLKIFHNIPLITKPQTTKDISQPQAPPDSVRNFIINQFKSVQPVLPKTWKQKGRATWGAATAFLGKVYLYNHNYKAADTEFRKVIKSGLYHLVKNYAWNFDDVHEHNSESIFEINFSYNGGNTVLRPGDANETVNLTPQKGWKNTQLRTMEFSPQGFGWADIQAAPILLKDFKKEKTVKDKLDPRVFATLVFNNPKVDVYGNTYAQVYGKNSHAVYWAKYEFNNKNISSQPKGSDVNNRIMRYADVLLMYAETRNHLGDQATAAKMLHKIRARAHLPNREAKFASDTKKQVFKQIVHQRILELAGEGKRFDDLRRWGWLTNPQKLKHLAKRNSDFKGFKPSRIWMPIPQGEINTNPAIKQNPGY